MERKTIKLPSIKSFEAEFYSNREDETYEPYHFPTHIHDTLEIYILIEGDVSFMVENKIYEMKAGDVIISRANQLHNCILNSQSVHKHLCMWFDNSSAYLFSSFNEKVSNHVRPTKADCERLNQLYLQLEEFSANDHSKGIFYTLLEILDIIERNGDDGSVSPKEMPDILQEILNDLNANFATITNLTYVLDKYFISYSTLYRLFKEYVHIAPKAYLEVKKIAYSRVLLKEGCSVKEACSKSGFSDCSNFIRLFKLRFGVTPKQYRTT